MKAYHFSKDIKEGFLGFFNDIILLNGFLCFDFEDSISLKENKERLKEQNSHRDFLINEIEKLSNITLYNHIGFRINSVKSKIYKNDLNALNALKEIHTVFIPKVEHKNDLIHVLNHLKLEVFEVIPIIETKEGFKNIEQIVSVTDYRFKSIAFGHCDYNFSLGHFPFYHQNTSEYWDWVKYLNDNCIDKDLGLINSPVLELNNYNLFYNNLIQCAGFSQIIGQITLCKSQTRTCNSFQKECDEIKNLEEFKSEKLDAKSLIYQYENNIICGKTFAIDQNRTILSPQEYKAAKLKNT
ncbi:MAG TPA: hypothetical protein DCQ26_00245 [Marinilabiliales bacterium]|nr:MAG: hypothetical protein A2W95_03740 [Bacteroidetes bacterium GWA2_40_14]OFX61224.1 MAG: hypothetical protein A2W84_00695 [Bacteroidetes bacterium GWC2_40_13]OFX75242.1 MAG: hypothetical protein A2W96_16730 [Bacteroidetes bacterium GWD2_40_43]OFX89839.1 MAG: hypothetical protein A2W97_12390 [Bacteroidetes bacterium GWE2_40_63]OFY21968.1 MAG: hypothetical protein A2W88_00455 [Bacteroidetes bacterium GWF2_40_13]OFZ30315.1 MAG: hypothetical protein A2437_09905 [Bacteroidetes bacterium RIFOXYC